MSDKITVTGDIRKFLEYVLVPQHRTGKDKIFINQLGYRPHNLADATELLALYIEQAEIKFAQGDYLWHEADKYGQRFTIEIEVRGRVLLTGWILDNAGNLKLATPFTGFKEV